MCCLYMTRLAIRWIVNMITVSMFGGCCIVQGRSFSISCRIRLLVGGSSSRGITCLGG